MKSPSMVFKCPGPNHYEGIDYDYKVVEASAVPQAIEEGWFPTIFDAAKAADEIADEAPPTREELEAKAAELGIKVDRRFSDAKIAALIDASLDAQE